MFGCGGAGRSSLLVNQQDTRTPARTFEGAVRKAAAALEEVVLLGLVVGSGEQGILRDGARHLLLGVDVCRVGFPGV